MSRKEGKYPYFVSLFNKKKEEFQNISGGKIFLVAIIYTPDGSAIPLSAQAGQSAGVPARDGRGADLRRGALRLRPRRPQDIQVRDKIIIQQIHFLVLWVQKDLKYAHISNLQSMGPTWAFVNIAYKKLQYYFLIVQLIFQSALVCTL